MLFGPILVVAGIAAFTSVIKLVEKRMQLVRIQSQVHLVVNGNEYLIDNPEDSFYALAIEFCSKEGVNYGFDMSSFDRCTRPLVSALNKGREHRTWNGRRGHMKKIELSLTAEHSPAKQLEAGASIPVEDSGTGSGSGVAVTHPDDDGEQQRGDRETAPTALRRQLPLEIDGVTYLFEYDSTADAEARRSNAAALADTFCSQHGQRLLEKHMQHLSAATTLEGPNSAQSADSAEHQRLVLEECYLPVLGALAANMV